MIKFNLKKHILLLCCGFFSLTVIASDQYTKGVLMSEVDLAADTNVSAVFTELSPSAMEKGLRDAQLLAKPTFNKSTKVLTLNWHSIVKTINGTEHSKVLSDPLVTQLKVSNNSIKIAAGQNVTMKGDFDAMIVDFDELLASSKTKTSELDSDSDSDSVSDSNSDKADSTSDSGSSGSSSGSTGSDSTETPDVEDYTADVDNVTTTYQECDLAIDWNNGVVNKQQRAVETSESGEVEYGACTNYGSSSTIERDYSSACDVQINGLDTAISGYTQYSYVNSEKITLSECKWDNSDQQNLTVKNDFSSCSLDDAKINTDAGTYSPAGIKYALIDKVRYDLSECEVVSDVSYSLPTKISTCEMLYTDSLASKRERTDILYPDGEDTLREGNCEITKSYSVSRDYDYKVCVDLPDYDNSLLTTSYKNYYLEENSDDKEYFGNCTYDFENKKDLFQDASACTASEDLLSNVATLNKIWSYFLPSGEKVEYTDCIPSKETYPIVETTNTCSPTYIESTNSVVINKRKGWQDASDQWHYSDTCKPSTDSGTILTEFDTVTPYEHDFINSQSYKRSRDYYTYLGERVYINEFSRNTAYVYPHSEETCGEVYDDNNYRSVVSTKIVADLEGTMTELKECTNSAATIPYQHVETINFNGKSTLLSNAPSSNAVKYLISDGQLKTLGASCGNSAFSSEWGSNFTILPNSATYTDYKLDSEWDSDGDEDWEDFFITTWVYKKGDGTKWRRPDGSYYYEIRSDICSKNPI